MFGTIVLSSATNLMSNDKLTVQASHGECTNVFMGKWN